MEEKVKNTMEENAEQPAVQESAEQPAVQESAEQPAVQESAEQPAVQENAENEQNASELRCVNCLALLKPEHTHCPECGAPQRVACKECGAELASGEKFCKKCGAKVDTIGFYSEHTNANLEAEKNKKKKTYIIIGAVVAAIVVIALFVSNSINEKKRVEEYMATADEYAAVVLNNGVNLEEVGDEIVDNWYDYVYDRWTSFYSVEDAVYSAMSDMEYYLDEAEAQHSTIVDMHETLSKPVNSSPEMKELSELATELYNAYVEFYECVTDPTGNYSSFSSEYFDLKDELLDAYNAYEEHYESMK